MSHRTQRSIGRIVSPLVIAALKVHTRVTGTERARVIICDENGRILLVRGFVGVKWSLPGGGIEKGESPLRAARREVYEELRLRLNDEQLTPVGTLRGSSSPVNYVAHIYTAHVSSADYDVTKHNRREIIEQAWFDPLDLPQDISSIVKPCLALVSK
jgi:8-oxo-dGTP pyrophosphatase MutT (NUDIX family)